MSPFLLAFVLGILTQEKSPIDTSSIGHWPRLAFAPELSSHGKYLWYTVEEQPRDSRTNLLRQIHSNWKREFPGPARCSFAGNERQAVIQQGDSLHLISLGKDQQRSIRITSVKWPSSGEGRWLAYQEKSTGHLILNDLLIDNQQDLGPVIDYAFDEKGRTLVVAERETLIWLELQTGQRKQIWTGANGQKTTHWRFDNDGRQLAFIVTDSDSNTLWLYQPAMQGACIKLAAKEIDGPLSFSQNGRWIFFSFAQRTTPPPPNPPSPGTPDIWGWADRRLQPARVSRALEQTPLLAVTPASEGRSLRVESPGERIITPPNMITGEHLVLRTPDNCYWTMSLAEGTRKKIAGSPTDLSFSPDGHWLVYYNNGQYCSDQLTTGTIRNLTQALPHGVSNDYPRGVGAQAVAEPLGWLANGKAVLLYDNYDLWAVDPAGKRPSVCLTRGYGFTHHIKLRVIGEKKTFSPGDTLLLTGFNTINQYNGFFRLILGQNTPPECRTLGPYTYYKVESQKPHRSSFDDGMLPRKAVAASFWVVKRESASEAPNFFLTTDFKHFEQLTNLAPQRDYNWLTTELITYTQLDGTPGKGILYKPENFDPTKRYPLIFNIYEQFSHRLYEFPQPAPARDNIDIPWLVSRGYLVFTPDIRYRPATISGKTTGQWAYNAVVAAVRHLSKFPYIDPRRLGIQGHSLGAGETSYLLTHTHLFAAAAEMAGVTDPVSAYLGLLPAADYPAETQEGQYIWESGQARIGATLWQRPGLYLRESAVLHADKITTPLLLVHNKPDAAVPWRQSVELYLALRRLEKPVWLLQYEGENHSFLSETGALDYTLRLTDFFDHYLKAKPLPVWMTPQD